jgi:Mrp family chromosome partitioning ATPase
MALKKQRLRHQSSLSGDQRLRDNADPQKNFFKKRRFLTKRRRKMEFKTDIQIAQETEMKDILDIAASVGIDEKHVEKYGNYKAKIDYNILNEMKDTPDGKLILVTAISPTPAGEGKTTTSVGLADACTDLARRP